MRWLTILALTMSAAHAAETSALANWQQVLTNFVDSNGRINFRLLATERQGLDDFVAWLANHGPITTPRDFPSDEAIKAYHLNAYNALAMHGVLERDLPANFSSFFKRASFFRFRKIVVDGQSTNLYDYENKIIRPLGDARVHFALNCMVRSCPRLPRKAFEKQTVDATLDDLTREFFATPEHLRINADKRRVAVSAILDFYTKDFVASGKARDLLSFINRYLEQAVPRDYQVTFIDYDWTVNQSPR